MLSLPPAVQLFACTTPVDMRKSFDGLAAAVESALDRQPLDGHVYCFFSRNRRHLRLLWWDRDGFLMVCKRLERGAFQVPWRLDGAAGKDPPAGWALGADDLSAILQGVDLRSVRKLPRWRPPA
jgi:transposase